MTNTLWRSAALPVGVAVLVIGLGSVRADETVIVADRIVTLNGPDLEPGEVHVRDGKVIEVGSQVGRPEGARVLELDGTLLPGLVDVQSRISVAGGSSEMTREITPEFQAALGIDFDSPAVHRARAGGITTAGVLPGNENVVAGLASIIKTSGQPSIVHDRAALVINMTSDPTARNSSRSRPETIYIRQPTNRMGVVWLLRSTFHHAQAGEGVDPVTEALDGSLPLLSRSRRDFDILSALRVSEEFGLRPVVLGGEESYRIAPMLAEADVPVVLGPLSSSSTNGPEGSERAWNVAQILDRNGVVFALSGGDLLEQARFAVRFGLPREAAIRAITLAPAQILGIENRVGSIAAGADADFVALGGDPLEFTTPIDWVMIDGNIFEERN